MEWSLAKPLLVHHQPKNIKPREVPTRSEKFRFQNGVPRTAKVGNLLSIQSPKGTNKKVDTLADAMWTTDRMNLADPL